MADDEINGDSDEAQQTANSQKIKEKKHDSGAADLEKVTDYAEEKEISPSEDVSVIFFSYNFMTPALMFTHGIIF